MKPIWDNPAFWIILSDLRKILQEPQNHVIQLFCSLELFHTITLQKGFYYVIQFKIEKKKKIEKTFLWLLFFALAENARNDKHDLWPLISTPPHPEQHFIQACQVNESGHLQVKTSPCPRGDQNRAKGERILNLLTCSVSAECVKRELSADEIVIISFSLASI